jgi:hypothetical protein
MLQCCTNHAQRTSLKPTSCTKQYIADNSTGLAGALAQGLLNEYYGYGYEVVPQVPGGLQALTAPPHHGVANARQLLPMFTVMPNPARKEVIFRCDVDEKVETAAIRIFNLDGQLVKQFQLGSGYNKVQWDADGLLEGIYYCQFFQAGHSPSTLKLILMK